MSSPHRVAYLELMQLLFETYSKQIDPMIEFIKNILPVTAVELKHPKRAKRYTAMQLITRNCRKSAEIAYRATVRAHAY
jgi:hypothetical protein